MKDLQYVIGFVLENHEKRKKYIAFLLALSVMMAFGVSFILIKPADSMTGQLVCGYETHTHSDECYQLICTEEHQHTSDCFSLTCGIPEHAHSQECYAPEQNGGIFENMFQSFNIVNTGETDTEWFTSPQAAIPQGAIDFSGKLTTSDNKNSSDYSGIIDNPTNTNDPDIKSATFKLSYKFEGQSSDIVNASQPYIYYLLPEGVTIADDALMSGTNCKITDENREGDDKLSGYYSIANTEINGKQRGLIVIRFTRDYLEEIKDKENLHGNIEFKANVSRADTDEGDRTIDFGNNITVKIEFYDKAANISKKGELLEKDENGNYYIKWTVTVKNPTTGTNLTGYTLTDSMLSQAVEIMAEPEGIFDTSSKTFTGNISADQSVIITYKTLVSDDDFYTENGKNISNEAKLTKDKKTLTANASVTVPAAVTIQKVGSPDYKTAGNGVRNKINWTITIENKQQKSLGGYIIEDTEFTANMTDITAVDENGNAVEVTVADGRLTIDDSSAAKKVVINYITDAVYNSASNDGTTKNRASVTYPNNAKGPATNDIYVYYKPYNFSKDGEADYVNQCIKWKISLWDNDYNQNTIDGFKITDTAFANLTSEQITVQGKKFNDETQYPVDFDLSSDTLTLKGDYKGCEITYSVPLTDEQKQEVAGGKEKKFSNSAVLSNDLGYTANTSKEVYYTPRNTVRKELISKNLPNSGSIDSSLQKQELNWKVEMTQDTGFTGASKSFVDVMQAINSTTNKESGDHYIAPEQRNAIKVYGKTDTTDYVELDSSNYTIVYYKDKEHTQTANESENAHSFVVEFNSSVDDSGYKSVQITYPTTADFTGVTPGDIKFTNEATFNGASSNKNNPPEYTVEVYDPDIQPYTKYALDKDGNKLDNNASVALNNVQKAKIGDTEYYIFGWQIDAEKTVKIIDTLPDGFTLYTKSDGDQYKPIGFDQWNRTWELSEGEYGDYIYENGEITFKKISESNGVKYYTKIPVADFDNKVGTDGTTVSNSIVDGDSKYTPQSATVNVIPGTSLIEKNYTKQSESGADNEDTGRNKVSYTLDVNPEGKDLVNGDTIIINDLFRTVSYTENLQTVTGNALVDAALDSLKVYRIDSSGNERLLNTNEYSYIVEKNPVYTETVNISEKNHFISGNYHWFVFDVKSGDKLTVELLSTPNTTREVEIKFGNDSNKSNVTFDENGKYVYTGNAPYDCDLGVGLTSEISPQIKVTAVREVTDALGLTLSVPDATHLKVVYTYLLTKDGYNLPNDAKLVFSNSASINGGDAKDSVDNISLQIANSLGNSGTDPKTHIKKVDTGDYSITGLNAKFKLAKFDSSSWKWVTDMGADGHTVTSFGDESSAVEITVNGTFEINGLANNTLYALKETAVPQKDGFTYEPAEKVKPLYFAYNAAGMTSYPNGINSETVTDSMVNKVQVNGDITVPNNQLINISVLKHWDNTSLTDTSAEATLYWSYQNAVYGFPDDSKLFVADAAELNMDLLENPKTFTDSCTWNNLPNGKDGKPIYYYVKETAYTVSGVKYTLDSSDSTYKANNGTAGAYTPNYTGNAVNQNGSNITIINSHALTVQKVWRDANNKEITPPADINSVSFKIWGKETENGTETLIKNGDSDTFTLSGENNWAYQFSNSQLGNYQYFRIEEMSPPEGYSVSYNDNHKGQTGIFTIINKNNTVEINTTSITVEKNWIDSGESSRPDNITLKLMQSTDKTTWSDVSITQPAPVKNGNKWTFTYNDLPAKDDNGNVYYYKIAETVPAGYEITSEINNDGIASGTIQITNTLQTGTIYVNKQWNSSVGNNPDDVSEIKVEVYRKAVATANMSSYSLENGTNYHDPAVMLSNALFSGLGLKNVNMVNDDLPNAEFDSSLGRSKLSINSTNAIYSNNVITLTVSAADIKVIKSNGSDVELYFDEQFITANQLTDKIIKQSDISDNSGVTWNWLFGIKTGDLSNTHSANITSYCSAVHSKNGFTLNNNSLDNPVEFTITFTLDGETSGSIEETTTTIETTTTVDTGVKIVVVNEIISDLKIGDTITVTFNGPANQYFNGCFGHNDTVSNWYKKEFEANFDSNGMHTLSYTLPDTYTGNMQIQIWWVNNSTPKSIEVSVERTAEGTTTTTTTTTTSTIETTTITAEDTIKTITFEDSAQPDGFEIPEGAEPIQTITLTGNSWSCKLDNMPIYDKSGNTYVYYIKEISIKGTGAEKYKISSYTNNGITPDVNNPSTVSVSNEKIPDTSSVTMPSTGGKGILIYYLAGTAVFIGSIAGYIVIKRRLCRNVK